MTPVQHRERPLRHANFTRRGTIWCLLLIMLSLALGLPISVANSASALLDPNCVAVQGKVLDPYGRGVSDANVLVQDSQKCADYLTYPASTQTAADGTWLAYAKRLALPQQTVTVEVRGYPVFGDASVNATPNLTIDPVAANQIPSENTVTVLYRIELSGGQQYIRSGGTINFNALTGVPLPTDTPSGQVVVQRAGSMADLTPGQAYDSKRDWWTGSYQTPPNVSEGPYYYWVCAPKTGYTGTCSGATTSNLVAYSASNSYIVDNTPPTIDATSFTPADGTTTVNTSGQYFSVKSSDAVSGIDTSHTTFTLQDITAGTSISFGVWSYDGKRLVGGPQTLQNGHIYCLSGTVTDRAGNVVTASQKPPSQGGCFLASSQSLSGAQADIAMYSGTLSPVSLGTTTRTATFTNIPFHLGASSVTLGGSRQVGSGFVDQSISLANLMVTTGGCTASQDTAGQCTAQRSLAQKVYSSNAPSRITVTRFDVSAPFTSSQTFTVPARDDTLRGGSINVEVPAYWTDAELYLDPVTTTANAETCPGAPSSSSITCTSDPMRTRYLFQLRDTSNVSASADTLLAGTDCTKDGVMAHSFIAICPFGSAVTLSNNSAVGSSAPMLPETPTAIDPTFDANLEQLIQDQADALGGSFGGAIWADDGTVTFRLTSGTPVPSALQGNPKIVTTSVTFGANRLDAAMNTIAAQLNPLLAPNGQGLSPDNRWPWFAHVDLTLNKVLLTVDPTLASQDSQIQGALANELNAGTVVLSYAPTLPVQAGYSTECISRRDCSGPVRAGTEIHRSFGGDASGCTMGFTMVGPLDIRYLSTAGHCGVTGSWSHNSYWLNGEGTRAWIRNTGSIDFQAFPEDNPLLATPQNYIDRLGAPDTPILLGSAKPSAVVGNKVCMEAQRSGQQCAKVEEYNASWGGRPGFGTFTPPQSCHGDSGSPIVNYSNSRPYGSFSGWVAPAADCYQGYAVYFPWMRTIEATSGYKVLTSDTTDTLGPGQTIYAGETIRSSNNQYELLMDGDGVLKAYKIGNGTFWSTPTYHGDLAGYHAVLRADGGFVILNAIDQVVWNPGCNGGCVAGSRLVIQGDRNIVLYKPDGSVAWASGTNI